MISRFPLLLIFLATTLTASTAAARPDVDEEMASLHREIAALRIVHHLDLSAEQLEELIPLVQAGIGLREDLEGVMEKSAKSNLAVLRQVRDDLADDGVLDEAIESAAEDAHKATEKAMRPVHWELKDLGEDVMDVLDEEQRQRVMRALSRPPFGPQRRGPGGPGAGPGEGPGEGPPEGPEMGDGERVGPPRDAQGPRMSQAMEQGVRRHNARQIFGVVFSDEFLSVLEDQMG